ncbi:MAG: hypothetical protein KKF44_07730 [Nanoarchaeota archaeon]|nr:hypothetical protein [Nanoarchaeota archaeon]
MSDISDLMTITPGNIVPCSQFDSTYGMDEDLYDTWKNDLPANLSMGEAIQQLHPTRSELRICDIGCGIKLALPFVEETKELSKGQALTFPALKPEDILTGPPNMQPYSGWYWNEVVEKLAFEGGLKVHDRGGIDTDTVAVSCSIGLGDYICATAKYDPEISYSELTELTIGYYQIADTLLEIRIKKIPNGFETEGKIGGYLNKSYYSFEFDRLSIVNKINFVERHHPINVASTEDMLSEVQRLYSPLLKNREHDPNNNNIDFYETVTAMVDLVVNKNGDINSLLKYQEKST